MFTTALQETLHQQSWQAAMFRPFQLAQTVPWFVDLCVDACLLLLLLLLVAGEGARRCATAPASELG